MNRVIKFALPCDSTRR